MSLQFKKVKKYYGAFLALDIPELTIPGGIWWVKGENGSGKTTLLKMIAGLHPFDGEILLDELTIKKHRRQFVQRVNYAEAEPLYPPFLTAKDLVELYCKTKGGTIPHAQDLLKKLHIDTAYTKPVAAYSSGMVKKLSLALAFIGNPKLILLDEPLITIDVHAVNVVCNIIRERHSIGVSFIITSHQTLHADQLAFTGNLIAENHTIQLTA
jgi:ABC-2 type transport system ATP-binding protein